MLLVGLIASMVFFVGLWICAALSFLAVTYEGLLAEYALYPLIVLAVAFYQNMDIDFMMNERYDFYQTNDFPMAFSHLYFDIFFLFWRDLFRRYNRRKLRVAHNQENELQGGNIDQSEPNITQAANNDDKIFS